MSRYVTHWVRNCVKVCDTLDQGLCQGMRHTGSGTVSRYVVHWVRDYVKVCDTLGQGLCQGM